MTPLEPILKENKDRFVMFPIAHKEIWKLYKEIENKFWVPKVSTQAESREFRQMEESDRTFLST